MPRTRPPYPPKFRAEAVRLVHCSGELIREVAEDLGVSEQTLRNWVRQGDLDDGLRDDRLTTSEREELRRLRRRVRVLEQEHEILWRAAVESSATYLLARPPAAARAQPAVANHVATDGSPCRSGCG